MNQVYSEKKALIVTPFIIAVEYHPKTNQILIDTLQISLTIIHLFSLRENPANGILLNLQCTECHLNHIQCTSKGANR